jgi:signal transduction histidine kinase
MFKKTRNRIMLTNMAMVSSAVIVAFAVIFAVAFAREQEENRLKLERRSMPIVTFGSYVDVEIVDATQFSPNAGGGTEWIMPDALLGFTREHAGYGASTRISPDTGMSFSIIIDEDGNLIETLSFIELSDVAYRQAALEAAGSEHGRFIKLDGRTWQFDVEAFDAEFKPVFGLNHTASDTLSSAHFLDVTDSNRMLWSLGLTLLGAAFVTLLILFFISLYFANRAVRPMEEIFLKQRRFAADASHELKTPLSIIGASCSVMYANSSRTVKSQARWVDGIMRAADRMTDLTGELLSLSKLESDDKELVKSMFDLSAVVEEAAGEQEAAALDKDVKLALQIDPDITTISDKALVMTILRIIMDNAVKYTDDGGTITVFLKKSKRRVSCTIRNSGEGVPKEELPLLFDRFYRGDPARSSGNGGYGLGLAIAKSAADRLGIKITAKSEPGRHTEFALIF